MMHKSRSFLGYTAIALVGFGIAAGVNWKSSRDYDAAQEKYRESSLVRAQRDADKVTETFNQLYQGLRTISMLPSIKSIDRHGKNLDGNARESIIQIYNNLRSNVTVSEVYIVPASLEPEKIDPETGSFEVPILMFDDAVASHQDEGAAEPEEKITTVEQAEKVGEVEIYEYRVLKEQMAYFAAHYKQQSATNKMDIPLIGSPGVLTCDNGDFDKTKIDADRVGTVLSVPFYGDDGLFKGSVTAVLRDDIMRSIIPESNAALVNSAYNYLVLPTKAGEETISKDFVLKNEPDTSLIFSTVIDAKVPDPRSKWVMWFGYPDSEFLNSGDAKAVTNFRLFGFGFAALFTLVGFGIYAMIQRNFRTMAQNAANLEKRIAERTAEIEKLALEQENQKRMADAERKKSLYLMADNFEQSVKSVMSYVVSASAQMQAGTEQVAKIAEDTKGRVEVVSRTSELSAHTTAQISEAAGRLTDSISDVGGQAEKSHNVAKEVVEQAEQARGSIANLSEQSNKVGEIVGMITDISGQINLLALNATIESARAGEAGKGFAVVAHEVKELASQVNKAAEQISAQITEMQLATATSVESVQNIINTIHVVTDSIQSVANSMAEQARVTHEIAQNIATTASGAQDISQNIQEVENGAMQTELTASEVLTSAKELSNQSSILQGKVEEFLRTVRAV